MKRLSALSLMIAAFLLPALANAQEQANPVSSDPIAAEAKLVEVGNKICPVSHEEVGKEGMEPHKVTYKGKVYNLCCAMCEKDFNKDPEKYTKIMDEEVAKDKAAADSKS